MKVVSQIVSTCAATMTVEYSEEADLWPLNINILLIFRFQNIKNNTDPIFIIITNNALVCICSI